MREDRVGSWLVLVVVAASSLFVVAPALAEDGKLEINLVCAAVGCFDGDTAGSPVQITNRGSYILTGNLNAAFDMGTTAIQITGSPVTLDLNGFTVDGGTGISMSGVIGISADRVEVRNGALAGLGGVGISASSRSHLRLLNLRIHGMTGPAIDLSGGSNIQIIDTVVSGNGEGIVASGEGVIVEGCTVTGNTNGDGIRAGMRSLIADNVVTGNLGDGIEVGTASVVRGNVLGGNGQFGINLTSDTLVIGNTAIGTGGAGSIEACASCTMVDNEAP